MLVCKIVARTLITTATRSAACATTRASLMIVSPRLAAAQETSIGTATSARAHTDRLGIAARRLVR